MEKNINRGGGKESEGSRTVYCVLIFVKEVEEQVARRSCVCGKNV